MGLLVDGKWSTEWYGADEEGRFVREATRFRGRVTPDGSSGHAAEAGRYHLYVSYACPWAHRTLVLRARKGLEEAISVSVVDPFMGDDGWSFGAKGTETEDALFGERYLRDIYLRASPRYSGRVTVPVLWDREKNTIVSNESREILRMLDHAFDPFAARRDDYCPEHLARDVDAAIDAMYEPVNNGVYRAGFASSQVAYDEAIEQLFAALDGYDARLASRRYLLGDTMTEADICLFTTLVRFDPVYATHFKCNLRRIVDYPNLWGFVRDVYQLPGVADVTRFDHIKEHYFRSHPHINPTRIVPRGPLLDFGSPHGRENVSRARG
jgi:putative glutathione S-transferase